VDLLEEIAKIIFEGNGSDYSWEEVVAGNVAEEHKSSNPDGIVWARDIAGAVLEVLPASYEKAYRATQEENKKLRAALGNDDAY